MPGDSSTPDSSDLLAQRLQRLEESLGFAQHENEQLAAEVLVLGRRLQELSRRVDALEQRQRASEAAAARSPEDPDAGPPNDPPPHSAGPMSRSAP